jgi:hypothetical protein
MRAGQPGLPAEIVAVLDRAKAETADGAIGAAGAIAGNLDYGFSRAALEDGGVINVPGAPLVAATGDMDVDTFADANSVTSGTGIGAAVALNVDGQVIESAIGVQLRAKK